MRAPAYGRNNNRLSGPFIKENRLVQAHPGDSFKELKQAMSCVLEDTADRVSNLGKEYLKLLGNKIRVNKKEMRLSSIYVAMADVLCMSTKLEHFGMAPGFDPVWLTMADSN